MARLSPNRRRRRRIIVYTQCDLSERGVMFSIIQKQHQISETFLKEIETAYDQFLNRTEIGFPQVPMREHLWSETEELGKILKNKYKKMVVVGIGGSSLGTRVLAEVFGVKNIYFVDNVDANEFENLFSEINDLNEVVWVAISKSGTTIETLCALEYVNQIYQKMNFNFFKNVVVISEAKSSSLTDWAEINDIPMLEIPLDVGGRFSVLSPVGMLPAVFAGLNIEKIRKGAILALEDKTLTCQFVAQSLQSFKREEWITLFWFYCSRMKSYGMWLQQLWAESLGKKVDRKNMVAPRASTPMWAIGATDQHSILQQVMEGTKDKFVIFFRFAGAEGGTEILKKNIFKETESLVGKTMGELIKAEAVATQEALTLNGVSTLTIQTKVIDEEAIGFLFMIMQMVVAVIGEKMNINAFDQPGVELGKRLAKEKLKKA